jgi:hypothetical protein
MHGSPLAETPPAAALGCIAVDMFFRRFQAKRRLKHNRRETRKLVEKRVGDSRDSCRVPSTPSPAARDRARRTPAMPLPPTGKLPATL